MGSIIVFVFLFAIVVAIKAKAENAEADFPECVISGFTSFFKDFLVVLKSLKRDKKITNKEHTEVVKEVDKID